MTTTTNDRCPTCGRRFAHARADDHVSSLDAARKQEPDPSILTRGSHRHRLLAAYRDATPRYLSDTEAGERAGIGLRSSPWRRCTDLREAGYITFVGYMARPGGRVMLCAITSAGVAALDWLDGHPDARVYRKPQLLIDVLGGGS